METRHLDFGGRPFCASPSEGAFVVERTRNATCPLCLQVVEALSRHAGLYPAIPDASSSWIVGKFVRNNQTHIDLETL